jgi:uncharacterized iron-regulated protein
VIFIGDHHNQDDLHRKIAHLITDLHKRQKTIRFASEWFTPEDDSVLSKFVANTISEEEFLEAVNWKKRVGYQFDSFKPIYSAVKKAKGSIVGINLTKKEQEKISTRNFEAMSKEERAFFDNLDLSVAIHRDLVYPHFNHCHKYSRSKENCSDRMYRVQVAWDSKMAMEIFRQTETLKQDELLIVLAGAMHFQKGLGINLRFARLSHEPFYTLIPLSDKEKSIAFGFADGGLFYKSRPLGNH